MNKIKKKTSKSSVLTKKDLKSEGALSKKKNTTSNLKVHSQKKRPVLEKKRQMSKKKKPVSEKKRQMSKKIHYGGAGLINLKKFRIKSKLEKYIDSILKYYYNIELKDEDKIYLINLIKEKKEEYKLQRFRISNFDIPGLIEEYLEGKIRKYRDKLNEPIRIRIDQETRNFIFKKIKNYQEKFAFNEESIKSLLKDYVDFINELFIDNPENFIIFKHEYDIYAKFLKKYTVKPVLVLENDNKLKVYYFGDLYHPTFNDNKKHIQITTYNGIIKYINYSELQRRIKIYDLFNNSCISKLNLDSTDIDDHFDSINEIAYKFKDHVYLPGDYQINNEPENKLLLNLNNNVEYEYEYEYDNGSRKKDIVLNSNYDFVTSNNEIIYKDDDKLSIKSNKSNEPLSFDPVCDEFNKLTFIFLINTLKMIDSLKKIKIEEIIVNQKIRENIEKTIKKTINSLYNLNDEDYNKLKKNIIKYIIKKIYSIGARTFNYQVDKLADDTEEYIQILIKDYFEPK